MSKILSSSETFVQLRGFAGNTRVQTDWVSQQTLQNSATKQEGC